MESDILTLKTPDAWSCWLAKHHASVPTVWVRIAKKGAALKTVTYEEALEVALCHGWIDGMRRSLDAESFIQKFTPRRPRSLWSKRNVAKAARLVEEGRMLPAGLAEVEAARADGRWQAAYDNSKDMTLPPDFLRAVGKDKAAAAFLKTLNRTQLFQIGMRLQTARTPEARARRMEALLARLAEGRA